MEIHDNRFKSLIQPIKDLAANWDIDIADSLEEYLEELEGLRISLDEGQSTLNFAEAALVIQGSAAVYSKKVEYLYQLVIQSIEFITKKKSNVLSKTNKNDENNNSVLEDEILLFGSDPSFLLLDHVIEEGKNIDMKLPGIANSQQTNSSILNTSAMNMSMSLLHSSLHDDHGGIALKLASSNIDANGALQIGNFHLTSQQPLDYFQQSLNEPMDDCVMDQDEGDVGGFEPEMNDGMDYWQGAGDSVVDPFPQPTQPLSADFPLASDPSDLNTNPTTNGNGPLQVVAPRTVEVRKASPPQAPQKKEYVLLDPHTAVGGSRSVKKGRTYRLPSCLSSQSKTSEPFDPEEEIFQMSCKHENLLVPALQPLLKAKKTIERRFQAAQRFQKAAERRQRQKEGRTHIEDEDFVMDHEGGDYYDEEEAIDPMFQLMYGHIEPEPVDAPSHAIVSEDQGDLGLEKQVLDHFEPDFDVDPLPESLQEEEDLARRVEAALNNADDYHSSYEMICKKFIEDFHRGAEAFARESQLSRRVSEWTNKLEPILQAQEEAKPFDIHYCADGVLEQLSRKTKLLAKNKKSPEEKKQLAITFEEVTDHQSSAEVCRAFLACLQLANLGNVEILAGENTRANEPTCCNDFKLKLVSEKRCQDIENFLAPSLR
eukprot:gene5316-5851_t